MLAGRTRLRLGSHIAACACLLVAAFTALAAAPLASLLPEQDQCNCGCRHEAGKLCCCRRAAHAAGPALESVPACAGKCHRGPSVPLRIGLFLPLPLRSAAAPLTAVSRAAAGAPEAIHHTSCVRILRDRAPPSITLVGD